MNNPETNNPQRLLSSHDYLEIGIRRKWYIIVPLVFSILVSFAAYKHFPKVYKATTLILVLPQSVPENLVQPSITDNAITRLNTISQEIMSRTRLEKVIGEFNLYKGLREKAPMEEVVETMRKAIEVKVQGEKEKKERPRNSFTISFEGEEPKTVMMVTNKLASLVIEEDLKVRESHAGGTSQFINKELLTMEDRLKRKEQEIRVFREKNMGQLPQQLDANLRILEQLQQQLRTIGERMRAADDRAIILQGQLEPLKKLEPQGKSLQEALNTPRISEDPVRQLYLLKRELADMQTRLRKTHPDVIDLKKKIAMVESQLEGKRESLEEEEKITVKNLPPPWMDLDTQRFYAHLTEQYDSALLEAKRLTEQAKDLKEQMNLYQSRIEDTPKKEQELVLLARDYDLLKTKYQSLLDKNLQAQMAENLERKLGGEQFRILDPAVLPEKPIKPNRNTILFAGGLLGIALGFGLAWFRESLDQSFHTVSDLEEDLRIPVLVTIPNLKKERKAA